VTGLPPGLAVKLDGVSYDGCNPSDGTMTDAKANYEQFLDQNSDWITIGKDGEDKRLFRVVGELQDRLKRQAATAAANGRRVEWFVMQEPVSNAIREWVKELELNNVSVIYEPFPYRDRYSRRGR